MDMNKLFDDNTRAAFENIRENNRESRKWCAFFAVFGLICMTAFGIVKNSEKTADFLGGRETVEKFFRANIIALAIVTVTLAVFVLAFLKSWKGMKSSIYQLLMTVGSAVLILYSAFSFIMSIVNIREDLDGAKSVTAEEFVLCKGSAGEGPGPGFIHPVKALKNPIQMFGVDSAAVIADRQHQPMILAPRLHADMLRLAVRQRIVQ